MFAQEEGTSILTIGGEVYPLPPDVSVTEEILPAALTVYEPAAPEPVTLTNAKLPDVKGGYPLPPFVMSRLVTARPELGSST